MSGLNMNLPLVNFNTELKEFQEEFGGSYTKRKKEIIYSHVRALKINQFKKVLDFLINKGGFLPAPEKFEFAAKPFVDQNYNEQKIKETQIFTGLVTNPEMKFFGKSLRLAMDGDQNALDALKKGLKELERINQGKINCKHCDDTGFVYACTIGKPCMADQPFNCFCRKSTNDPKFQTWGKRFADTYQNKRLRSAV